MAAALAAVLSGCSLTPTTTSPPVALPAHWNAPATSPQPAADWWRQFADPALERLVTQALAHNLDLELAAARVEEARAVLAGARADQRPTVDLQAQATRRRNADNTGGGLDNAYSVSGRLDYEVDLFGRLRSASTAARARLLESVYTAEALRLSVVTDTVSAYLTLCATEQQLRITDAAVATRQETVRVETARLRLGADSELTLRQAQAQLAAAQAQAASLRDALGGAQSALAVLTGATPQTLIEDVPPAGRFADLALPLPTPPTLPASLLERRPDIRAALAALRAADADIGAARAQWFPRLDLSALLSSDAAQVGNLFSGPAAGWSVSGALVAPLLDFGRSEAQLAGAQARRRQTETLYRQTVQTAFRDVRDTLTTLTEAQAREQAQAQAVTALSRARQLAELRYRAGRGQYLDLLDAERSLLTARLDRVAAARDARLAAATLFKALGGGWEAPKSGDAPDAS
jgi:multidrug efflux system outer membrane protein